MRVILTALLASLTAFASADELPMSKLPKLAYNLNCGLKPLPPIGCQVGACVCDASGTSCQWTFICG